MKPTIIALTIASAFALTLGVSAREEGNGQGHGPHRFGHGMHKGMALESLTQDLDLTPQQQAQVGPLIEQAKPQIRAIHEEAMQKTRAVMENTAAQIRPLLTPQQQQKFDEVKAAREKAMQAMRDLHEAKSK